MRDLSFPKSKRLITRSEFARVRQDGQRVRGSLLTLAWLNDPEAEGLRVGLITARKVGSAVLRNRVRRRLREIIRRNQQTIRPGTWMVVIAAPGASGATSAELEAEWLRLARRASILAP